MELVEGFIKGAPLDALVYKNHIVYRLVNKDRVQYILLRPGIHTGTNDVWKQTHYMVIEEPSATVKQVACTPAVLTGDPFAHVPGTVNKTRVQEDSQNEDKPFKKAWDEAGEEVKKRTLTPNDRIDCMVEALNNHLEETEKDWKKELEEHRLVFNDRLSTLEKSYQVFSNAGPYMRAQAERQMQSERVRVLEERCDTQAQALEKVMDIVNVLIKRVIAVEEKKL